MQTTTQHPDLGRVAQASRRWANRSDGHRTRLLRAAVLMGVLVGVLSFTEAVQAAYAAASSGIPWIGPPTSTGSANFGVSVKAARGASITWTSGPNMADLGIYPHLPITESKFTPVGPNGVTSKTFTGFTIADGPGIPCGSWAVTTGAGSATIVPGAPQQPPTFTASWTVTAGGVLGAPTTYVGPSYFSVATGNDPWPIYDTDLPQPPEPKFDLYIPVSLDGGASTVGDNIDGGYSLSVSYETGGVVSQLLSIETHGADVTVGSTADPRVSFYMLDSVSSAPVISGPTLSPSDIRQMLLSDLSGDGELNSPLSVGVYCDDFERPAPLLRDDAVAAYVHVDLAAHEGGWGPPTPEPSGAALMLIMALLGLRRGLSGRS